MPENIAIVETPRGSVEITMESHDVMLTTLRGHCDVELARAHISAARAAYARRITLHHFFDAEALLGYDSVARVELTRFAIENRAQVASAEFLVRSRLVAMGVATAALAARMAGLHFDVTTSRTEFLARLAKSCGRRASLRPRS